MASKDGDRADDEHSEQSEQSNALSGNILSSTTVGRVITRKDHIDVSKSAFLNCYPSYSILSTRMCFVFSSCSAWGWCCLFRCSCVPQHSETGLSNVTTTFHVPVSAQKRNAE